MVATKRKPKSVTWEKTSPGVTVIRVPYVPNKDWEQSFLLCSDRHWDNPHSDWQMQKDHLNQAVERGAYILENGDHFCAMQGKYDRRSDKSSVRPEHQYGDYLDRLVQTAAEWWRPWQDRFIWCGEGNHEEAIKNRHETDLIERFVSLMNASGARVINGGFGGYIRFRFGQDCGSGDVKQKSTTVTLHADHGYGGGGPVTHDAIQHQRRQVYLPDADIIWSGHTHDSWTKWVARKRLSGQDVVYQDEVLHLKTSTYKDDYGVGEGGWHARTGKPPKPLGAYWLRFTWNRRLQRVVFDVERAK